MSSAILTASDVLKRLHTRFSANFDKATEIGIPELERVDIKARAIAECGPWLLARAGSSTAQQQLANTSQEIFGDFITSVYLSAVGLLRPGQMVLRRGFEPGLALVYLWDLPHLFWGWKHCDADLSFTEMVDHFGSQNFRAFLYATEGVSKDEAMLDISAARKIYRTTSNTIHGKITTHNVLSAEGYVHNPGEWCEHLLLIDETTTLLLRMWFHRFPGLEPAVRTSLPSFDRVSQ